MNFTCPHCGHPSKISKPKAGRFKPKCPKCQKPFILVIDNAGKLHVQVTSSDNTSDLDRKLPGSDTSPSGNLTPQDVEATSQIREDPTRQLAAAKTQEIREAFDAAERDPNPVDPSTTADPISAVGMTGGFETVAFQEEATAMGDSPEKEVAKEKETIPRKLGGYRLDRQLGKGAMGTVFLATQVSLDRDVAIKILKPSLTRNPSFVSRFVREAYAAAQLVHHNVVQIYDIGSQGSVHYFSMELVKGDSLSGVVKKQKRIDCDTAAGYILQAARGLKFAHDQGMVHRDVKPANLMLDEHGIVKVADLGLVKIGDENADEHVAENLGASVEGDSQITQLGVSVGTPSYMAPEQWKKSSDVDQRADIYSLGCTFYVLVTGKLPFDGRTPREVVTKVITEQAIPPELIVKDIPKRISSIVNRMIAKEASDRYPDMGNLISDLEEYLGVSSTGAFSPSERHVEILEKSVTDFNKSPLAKIRKRVFQGLLGLSLILFVGGVFFSSRFAMGVLGLLVTTGGCYFLIRGLMDKTHLFNRTRDYLFSNQVWDWITMGITGVVSLVLVYFVLGITGSLVVGIAGPLLAAGLYFGIDKLLAIKRRSAIEESEKLFKVLRLRGLNEDLLRQFVCKFAGNHWEEYFEELFGYPAKISARSWLRGETGRRRSIFRWWRDPLIRWVDRRFDARDRARKLRHLEEVEMQKLMAQGIEKVEAKVRARNIAKLMTENAEAWKQSQAQLQQVSQSTRQQSQTQAAEVPKPTLSNLSRNLDDRFKDREPKVTIADRFHGTISFFIGPRVRFLVGVILFGLCLWWMQKNGKIAALGKADFGQAIEIIFSQNAYDAEGTLKEGATTEAISIPLIPSSLLEPFNSINHGWIGLVFIFSAAIWGWFVTIPVVTGGILAIFGTRLVGGLIPEEGFWVLSRENIALAAGLLVAAIGCWFFSPKADESLSANES
ncbi:MAG: protein kinase [Planctomycetota bacterium]|nr:protein kinase [Planctomycetota bacterium]